MLMIQNLSQVKGKVKLNDVSENVPKNAAT
jgi:hypothetical protein